MGDLGDGVRLRRSQRRLPAGDGRRGADRAAEEPLLAAPRRALARRRPVRGGARVRDRTRGLRRGQARAPAFFEAIARRRSASRRRAAAMVGDDIETDVGGALARRARGHPRADRQVPRRTRCARQASSRRRSWTRSPTCPTSCNGSADAPATLGSVAATDADAGRLPMIRGGPRRLAYVAGIDDRR